MTKTVKPILINIRMRSKTLTLNTYKESELEIFSNAA